MKTSTANTSFKKIVLLCALTIAPALAATSTAQAAPTFRAPVTSRNSGPQNWNNSNNAHQNTPRFNGYNQNAPRVQAPRFEPQRNNARFDDHRNDGHFDNHPSVPQRNDNKGKSNDTAKIIGAGIVGAILGAVLSH